jgi:hypothetical protein
MRTPCQPRARRKDGLVAARSMAATWRAGGRGTAQRSQHIAISLDDDILAG